MSLTDDLSQFGELLAVMAKLRSPEGCPWDRAQTHYTLRQNLLEECYEVLEAIDNGISRELCEELGDLLMQVVLHAQIAKEAGEFNIGDVIRGINKKLTQRHPHVFGGLKVKDVSEVLHNWQALKQKEKGKETSLLDGVSKAMPALAYSEALQFRAGQAGFDWKDTQGIIDKLTEEVKELKEAEDKKRREEEFGDLLFTLVNVGRHMGIDLESALRGASGRFYRRFTRMEAISRKEGKKFNELSFEEQNALWEKVKKSKG